METRKHVHEEEFPVTHEEMFKILITPSAICKWWQASRAIVLPKENGIWVAAWGEDEDNPDYIGAYTIGEYEPPKRILFTNVKYYSKEEKLPFDAEFTTEFVVTPSENGSKLKVTQDGFPVDTAADDFYAACEVGWKNTFEGVRSFLSM